MSDIIPALGSIGTYTFATPFSTLLPANENYTCQGIRSVSELLASGINVFNTYYVPNGLSQGNYDTAIRNNTYIISLQCSTGLWAYVPANYISSPPSVNGIPYAVKMLGVSLGVVRTDSDLSAIKTAISNLVRDNYGIIPEIKEIQVSKVKVIPNADDLVIQNARDLLINNHSTDTAKLLTLQQNYNNALLKITGLESYILSKKIVLGI